MRAAQVGRDMGLEEVRRIAITVGDHNLIPDMQPSPTAARQLKAAVLPDSVDARQDKVAGTGAHWTADQTALRVRRDAASGKRRFGTLAPLAVERGYADCATAPPGGRGTPILNGWACRFGQ
jgi:hypothetical protein